MATDVNPTASILIIEPFNGGSHKQLIDTLQREVDGCQVYALPAKKWHWRSRTSALYFAQKIKKNESFRTLFCSSVLNLAELVALRPDIAQLRKVLYFHENQLIYPVRKQQERDFQYGYNQILSCLVADVVVFNSRFNMESFLTSIASYLKLIPDGRPTGLEAAIRPKCRVLYFPVTFPDDRYHGDSVTSLPSPRNADLDIKKDVDFTAEREMSVTSDADSTDVYEQLKTAQITLSEGANAQLLSGAWLAPHQGVSSGAEGHSDISNRGRSFSATDRVHDDRAHVDGVHDDGVRDDRAHGDGVHGDSVRDDRPLHIVWPHRWEHDKGPDVLFEALRRLHEDNLPFKLSVLGETYTDVPEVFEESRQRLKSHVVHWGFQESIVAYFSALRDADVVVSTAEHEFYGVSMLEAAYLGCWPLAPNRLVYPEIFPGECLYNTPTQLYKKLRDFCRNPKIVRRRQLNMDFTRFSWSALKADYHNLLSPQGLNPR